MEIASDTSSWSLTSDRFSCDCNVRRRGHTFYARRYPLRLLRSAISPFIFNGMGGSACDRYDSLPFPASQFPSSLKLPSIYLAPTCKGNPLPSPMHCVGFKRNARRTSTISGHQWQQIEFENSYGLATLAFCFVRQIHLPLSTQIYGSSEFFARY